MALYAILAHSGTIIFFIIHVIFIQKFNKSNSVTTFLLFLSQQILTLLIFVILALVD